MTILRGIDEAWAKLDPELAASQGFGFIVGYVSQDPTKNLTSDDIARIHAAGLAVAFVMEYIPDAALGGRAAGIADANVALAHFADLGVPANIAAYSAGTDFNVQPGQMAVCKEFEDGFASTMDSNGYRYGAYTGYPFGLYLTQRNYGGFIWQTYAWSNGAWLANAALRQTSNGVHIAGIDVDIDESESIDFGQWEPGQVKAETTEEATVFLASDNAGSGIYLCDGMTSRRIGTPGQIDGILALRNTGAVVLRTGADEIVPTGDWIDWQGADGTTPRVIRTGWDPNIFGLTVAQ